MQKNTQFSAAHAGNQPLMTQGHIRDSQIHSLEIDTEDAQIVHMKELGGTYFGALGWVGGGGARVRWGGMGQDHGLHRGSIGDMGKKSSDCLGVFDIPLVFVRFLWFTIG